MSIWSIRHVCRASVAVLLTLLVACGGGDDGNGGTDPTGSFTIAVSPTALSIVQGGSGQATVTLTRTGGFTGAVAFTVQGAPDGVTGVVAGVGTGSVSTGQVTVNVALTVAPGTYPLTLRGSASGHSDRTAGVTLTVTAAGGLSLTANPVAVSVPQGGSGEAAITVTRTGSFAASVALAVTGAPTGVTAAVAPTSVAGGATTATLSLTVGAGVAPGAYPLVVTGTGAGVPAATVNVTLTVVAPTPDYSLAVAPASVSVAQGAEGTATVTLTRTGGFTGEVSLSLVGAPGGISGSFAPAVLSGAATTSTLTLTAASPAPGNYTVTIRGFSGDQTRDVTLAVTVTGSAFTVSVAPTSLTVAQGASGQATVTVARSIGFLGGVALSVTGLPAGVTAGFVPPSVLAGSTTSTMTLNVAGAVVPGTYPLGVTGSSVGWPASSANLSLTVTASGPPPGGGLSWQFCDPANAPLWFGYQDGNGPWQAVTPAAGNTYNFNISGATGGVAWVEDDGAGGFETDVMFATRAELVTLGNERCADSQPTKTLSGSVAGVAVTDQVLIGLGTAGTAASGGLPNFMIEEVPFGPVTLTAGRSSFNLQTFAFTPDRVIIRRNVDYPNGGTIPVLDFATEGFAPGTQPLTVTNLNGWAGGANTLYYTGNGTSIGILHAGMPTASGTLTYPTIPANQQQPGDFHYVSVVALQDPNDPGPYRSVGRFFSVAAPQTLGLGPAPTLPTVSSLGGAGHARLRFMGLRQAEYGELIQATFSRDDKLAAIFVTSGYIGGGTTYDFAFPAMSGVAGWNDAWAPATGGTIAWNIAALGWSGANPLIQLPSEGAEIRVGGIGGTLVTP